MAECVYVRGDFVVVGGLVVGESFTLRNKRLWNFVSRLKNWYGGKGGLRLIVRFGWRFSRGEAGLV